MDLRFPELQRFLASQAPASERPPLPLPEIPAVLAPPAQSRNLFAAGLSAGIDELQGLGGAAASALGQAVGIDALRDWGAGVAARNAQEAQANGRPDLEIAPWKEGGASVLPWLAYQATKQIPQIVPTVIAGMAAAPVVAPLAAGTTAARIGAMVPQILGGGGLRAGASAAAREAAEQAGARFVGGLAGATAASYPTGVGSLYQEALERGEAGGGAATQGDAFRALAMGVPYAALEGLQPASISRALQEGLKGGLATRVGKAAAAGVVTEAPTEAAQTVLENTFRPDLSAAQKAERIVDAALTGGAVGGVFGAAGGVRAAKVASPTSPNEELAATVDAVIAPSAPAPEIGPLAGLTAPQVEAGRARIEERLFQGEQSPALQEQLGVYRREETRRAFDTMDTEALAQNLASIRARLDNGEINTGLAMRAQAVEAELQRREALNARVPEQQLLFDEQQMQTPAPGQVPQVAVQSTFPVEPNIPEREMQTRARDLLGGKKLGKTDETYIQSITSQNELEFATRVDRDAAAGNQTALRLAAKLGLDKADNTINAELAQAQQTLATLATDAQIAETSARANPAALSKAQAGIAKAQARVDALQAQIALRDAVRQAVGTPVDEQRAPSAASPPPGSQTEPTPQQLEARFVAPPAAPVTQAQGELPLAMGRQTAEPQANPQTFEQASTFLKSAVGTTSNAQIEEIGRATIPDAVARISTLIGNKKPKGAVLTRMGRYFGLVDERNNPVGIETAIANTERAIATLQQQYDALPQFSPARQADVRRNLGSQSTVLTERLDALRAAQQVQQIDQTITVPGTPPEVQAQGRAARAQVTGQFPQPTIDAALRVQPLPEPVQPTAATQAEPVAPVPVVPTARPAPTEPQASRPTPNPQAVQAVASAEPGAQPADQEARANSEAIGGVQKVIVDRLTPVFGGDMSDKLRRLLLSASSVDHIRTMLARGRFDPGTVDRLKIANGYEQTIRERFAQPADYAFDKYEALAKTNAQSHAAIPELITMAAGYNLRPGKTWDEQPWLHGLPNEDKLKRQVKLANDLYRNLQSQNTDQVFWDLARIHEFDRDASLAYNLYEAVTSNEATKNIPGFDVDPVLRYVESSAENETPAAAAKYWRETLARMTDAVGEFLAVNKAIDSRNQPSNVSELGRQYNENRRILEAANEGVYFHLGRYGKYEFSLELVPESAAKDAGPSDAAGKRLVEKLEAVGINDVQILEGSNRRTVYMRVDTRTQLEALQKIGDELLAEKQVQPGSVKSGPRHTEDGVSMSPQMFQDLLGRFSDLLDLDANTSSEYAKVAQQRKSGILDKLRTAYIDSLPDNSVARFMYHRKSTSGFSKDAIRNIAFRHLAGSSAMANRVSARYAQEAFRDMQRQLNDAKIQKGPRSERRDTIAMSDIISELKIRQMNYVSPYETDIAEHIRGLSYHYYLSMSPAYLLMNLMQPAMLGWPELSKKNGFVNSFKAMAGAAPQAFRVMRAVLQVGRETGNGRAADATITERALKKAGLPDEMRGFLMQVANSGALDIGSMVRAQGRVADGRVDSGTDKFMRYVGAASYYTETFNRVLMALSAYSLTKDKSKAAEYAYSAINESMLDYTKANTARAFGRMGFAGPATPIMAQFMQFQMLTLEKLIREITAAAPFKNSYTAEERQQSRAFLGTLVMSTVTLAGTMGLPFAGLLASAVSRLVDLFDDDEEPFDAAMAYRNFLNSTFGPTAGNALARGLPRILGGDISSRVGFQDIVPLTQMIADRRNIEDLIDARASDLLGPAPDMAINILAGMREVLKGEYMKGMQSLVPTALKGPLKAYEMSEKGYVDKVGRQLPITADATDILYQALGLRPADKADYDEARISAIVRKGALTREAADIRVRFAKAIESGDLDAQRTLLAQARRFDQSNPAYAVLPGMPGTLLQRKKSEAVGTALGAPPEIPLKDVSGREAVRWFDPANY